MLTDVSVFFVILGVLGVVVGLQIMDVVRRGRARRRGGIPGSAPLPTPLMSPARWAAVGASLVLLAALWPNRRVTSPPRPKTQPSAPAPAAKGKGTAKAPANDPANRVPAKAPADAPVSAAAKTPAASPTSALTEDAAEERRWCNQGDRMMAAGQHGMAAQSYWEALRVQPRSQRARTGLIRARQATAEERTPERDETTESPFGSLGPPATRYRPQAAAPRQGGAAAGSGRDWGRQQDARFHRESGDRLLAQGQAGAAAVEYQKAIESDPSDVKAREGLDSARQRAAQAR